PFCKDWAGRRLHVASVAPVISTDPATTILSASDGVPLDLLRTRPRPNMLGSTRSYCSSQRQPSLPAQLPRDRTTLYDAHDLAAKLAVDDRPPWNQGELVAFLDHGELAAR